MKKLKERIEELRNKGVNNLNSSEREEFITSIDILMDYQISNPQVNKDDDFYNEGLILLVHEKSNWHLYCNKDRSYIYSIAVVPNAKSSSFGSINYFKRWYRYMKDNGRISENDLTDEAKEILSIK